MNAYPTLECVTPETQVSNGSCNPDDGGCQPDPCKPIHNPCLPNR